MHAIDADEQDVLYVGPIEVLRRSRDRGSDQAEGQSNGKNFFFQVDLLYWELGIETIVPAVDSRCRVLQKRERRMSAR